ncbi:MAG: helix-turn-helix transcriptional regulator [Bdellovibrio sp.]
MSKSFGEVLKQLMSERNLSVSQLAKAINCPSKTVQEWLGPHGRVPRDLEVLKRLAQHFNCSTHSLLFGEEDPRGILGDILEKTEIHTGLYEITIKKVKTGVQK